MDKRCVGSLRDCLGKYCATQSRVEWGEQAPPYSAGCPMASSDGAEQKCADRIGAETKDDYLHPVPECCC